MTPNTPVVERPPEEEQAPRPPMSRPAQPQPPVQQPPMLGYEWQQPVAPQWQPQIIRFEPTAAQRLTLAIVSIVLLIPLTAIAMGIAGSLSDVLPGWFVALTMLIAELVMCSAMVGVNLIFNADLFKTPRQR